jgi:hypothetical protein
MWTPLVDVAKRARNPKEGSVVQLQGQRGYVSEALCRGAKAHGRMNPSREGRGTAVEGERKSSLETGKLEPGRGNPIASLVDRKQYSEELATS